MIQSSRRDRKAKALAEVLALIADTDPVCRGEDPALADSEDERLWEDATAFSAALEKLCCRHPRRWTEKSLRPVREFGLVEGFPWRALGLKPRPPQASCRASLL